MTTRILLTLVVAAAAGAGAYYYWHQQGPGRLDIQTAEVKRGEAPRTDVDLDIEEIQVNPTDDIINVN